MQNRIVHNAKWIIGCKIMQSLVQFFVGILSVRYLGPSNYGLIDYAASIVAVFAPMMELGLCNTLVQEFVVSREKEGQIIGTHLTMNLLASVACIIGVTSFAAVANPGDAVTIQVCVLYSTSLFFRAIEMLQYWFQANLLSKYSSVAMLCSYLVVSAYKIYLLVSGKSVFWFALSHAVEYGVTGLLLLFAYHKVGTQKLSVSVSLMKEMFAKSKFYIIASLMGVAFNRVGNIFLKQFFGDTENGYYAAAFTCTCITVFVFHAIIDTARPVVLESKKESQEAFEKNVSSVYGIVTWLSLAQSIFFTIFAKLIIKILYGEAFLPAIPVLQILVWNTAFSYMGYVRNIWILGEEKHSCLWIINLGGAIASLVLNLLLIPAWGACGAAVASVLVQLFTNVMMGYILKPIRRNNALLLRGMNPKLAIELARTFLVR